MSNRSQWPTSKVIIAVAWGSDLIWAILVCLGNPAAREAGLYGFAISTVVFFIAKARYDRWKGLGG